VGWHKGHQNSQIVAQSKKVYSDLSFNTWPTSIKLLIWCLIQSLTREKYRSLILVSPIIYYNQIKRSRDIDNAHALCIMQISIQEKRLSVRLSLISMLKGLVGGDCIYKASHFLFLNLVTRITTSNLSQTSSTLWLPLISRHAACITQRKPIKEGPLTTSNQLLSPYTVALRLR
jgi:hypothetical protein